MTFTQGRLKKKDPILKTTITVVNFYRQVRCVSLKRRLLCFGFRAFENYESHTVHRFVHLNKFLSISNIAWVTGSCL